LVGSKIDESINTFFSTMNFLPNFKEVKTFALKSESILHYSIEDCIWASRTMKYLQESDTNVIYINAYDYLTFDDLKDKYQSNLEEKLQKFVPRTQCSFETVFAFPKPLNKRYMKCGTSYHYNKTEKTFLQIVKPFILENEEWITQTKTELKINQRGDTKNVKTYPMFAFTVTRFQEIDVGKVLYSQVSLVNSGGWTNSAQLMRKIIHDREVKLYRTTINSILKLPENRESFIENFQLNPTKKDFDGMAKLCSDLQY
jgi:hypothetical protein